MISNYFCILIAESPIYIEGTVLSTQQIAALCFNEVLYQKMYAPSEPFLQKEQEVRALLVANDCDSFKVHWMDPNLFYEFMTDINMNMKDSTYYEMARILKTLVPSANSEWKRIAKCVSHELSPYLGTLVKRSASDLGHVTSYRYQSQLTIDRFVRALNLNTTRKLTVSEGRYLVSLIQRATRLDSWRIPRSISKMQSVSYITKFTIICSLLWASIINHVAVAVVGHDSIQNVIRSATGTLNDNTRYLNRKFCAKRCSGFMV